MKWSISPFKGRWCSRRRANTINDILGSLTKPDRTKLYEEAAEFEKYAKTHIFRIEKKDGVEAIK